MNDQAENLTIQLKNHKACSNAIPPCSNALSPFKRNIGKDFRRSKSLSSPKNPSKKEAP